MRKLLVGGIAALWLLAPSTARAQLFLGARGAWAVPSGEIEKDASLKDAITGMPQAQVDLGVKLFGFVSIGGYASYGWTKVKDSSCSAGSDCSGQNLRLGVQVSLHGPLGRSSVWGGPFVGWEQQRLDSEAGGARTRVKLRGIEGGLQAGLDLPTPVVKVGPYVSASVGRYQTALADPDSARPPLAEKAEHGWFTFGVRGVFGL